MQIANWDDPDKVHETDVYKMKKANEHGYSVIRIVQEDVWNNKYDWLSELNNNINKLINKKKSQNIFMCKNNEYNNFN